MADFPALFAARLPAIYSRLGQPAVHTTLDGWQTDVQVIFDSGGGLGGIDGMMQGDAPVIRVALSGIEAGEVLRGDTFTLGEVTWQARENGAPLLDGAEVLVPLIKVVES